MFVLSNVVANDENEDVRIAAINGLGNFHNIESVKVLQQVTDDPKYGSAGRASAVIQLARVSERIKNYAVVPSITRLAKRGTETERRSAIAALGTIDTPNARSSLMEISNDIKEPVLVRTLALRGLSGHFSSSNPQLQNFLPSLRSFVKREGKNVEEVRLAAIELLNVFPTSQEDLIAIVSDVHNSDRIRQTALTGLLKQNISSRHAKILIDSFPGERNSATKQLILQVLDKEAEAGRKFVREFLVEPTSEAELKLVVLQGLVTRLPSLTEDELEYPMRYIGDKKFESRSRELLVNHFGKVNTSLLSATVVQRVATAFVTVGVDRSDTERVRLGAVKVARDYLQKASVQSLVMELANLITNEAETIEVKVEAIRLLSKSKDRSGLKWLIQIVHDHKAGVSVRQAAVHGIVDLAAADEQLRDALLDLARTEGQLEVREAAVRGLLKFSKDPSVFDFFSV